MTKKEFLRELEIMIKAEAGFIQEDMGIENLRGWDSLKNMGFRLFVEDNLGRELDGLKVDQARTVGDLLALVSDLLDD